MVLGGPGLARELQDVGLAPLPASPIGLAAVPDALAVGVDFALTYERLSIAAQAAVGAACFVATNRDPVFPPRDRLTAGAGSIVAALVVAGRREPDLVIGKPEPGLFREAAARGPARRRGDRHRRWAGHRHRGCPARGRTIGARPHWRPMRALAGPPGR